MALSTIKTNSLDNLAVTNAKIINTTIENGKIANSTIATGKLIAKEVGKESIWVPATAMYPNTTNGYFSCTNRTRNKQNLKH